jgi:DNA-binding NtrC family response regulator
MSAVQAFPVFTRSGGALVASSNSAVRDLALHRLNGRCHPVQHVHGGADALAKLEKGGWQVLFLDRALPDLDAEELRSIIGQRFPGIEVIVLDPEEDAPTVDVVLKTSVPERAVEASFLRAAANEAPASATPLPGMIGASDAMQRVYRMVGLVAARTTTVLIAGATGTGKELVARALHSLSPRAAKPLVVVNCAAIPEALLESELFGYRRGAFTGAVQSQLGRIAAAHGGTLFLDEVSELPLGMQAKLLRFLEQKEVQRLGASDVMRVDARVVAACNSDLAEQVARREFRQDLFYRLMAFPIELPPLAARRTDIVPLAEHFLACMAAALQIPGPRLSIAAAQILLAHSWPGNVREIQHVMERASILAGSSNMIEVEHLYFSTAQKAAPKIFPLT